jgi:hypothetical protein
MSADGAAENAVDGTDDLTNGEEWLQLPKALRWTPTEVVRLTYLYPVEDAVCDHFDREFSRYPRQHVFNRPMKVKYLKRLGQNRYVSKAPTGCFTVAGNEQERDFSEDKYVSHLFRTYAMQVQINHCNINVRDG